MKAIEAVMTLWEIWFEDSKGLDFDSWMELHHGKRAAEAIRDTLNN